MTYVELHAHSAYSFLDGASQPEELVARAAELGYDALALTDHDGVYGSLEFAHAAKHFGVRPITGAEVSRRRRSRHAPLRDAARVRESLPDPHRCAREDARAGEGARPAPGRDEPRRARAARGRARRAVGLRAARARRRRRRRRGAACARVRRVRSTSSCSVRTSAATFAEMHGCRSSRRRLRVPVVATGDVHAHHARRARLQDALVAIRKPHVA